MTEVSEAARRQRRITALGLLLLGLLWVWSAPGLVSSNDGSHLALGRALLRGETALGDEVALTLWVDRARREGRDYSDRPPGTAFLAAGAIGLGAWLDPVLLNTSLETKEIVVTPAAPRYAETYAARVKRLRRRAPPLLALQGTALLCALHCAVIGALGVLGVVVLLRRREVGPAGQAFGALTLGLGCLWGPYSTALFSHVTAGTLVIWAMVGLDVGLRPREDDDASWSRRGALLGAGLAAGWAASADYLVGLLLLGLVVATVPIRRWPKVVPLLVLGALPIVAATLAYHAVAFGSPWSLGYDHHANFEFARDRLSTFGGNPLVGLWGQWGLGQGAGVLALAPVMLAGAVGLARGTERRWLLGALPWILLLAAHRTPTGGAAEDHRYIVPLMPVLAVGLGLAWHRWVGEGPKGRWIAAGLLALAVVSGGLSWTHVRGVWG